MLVWGGKGTAGSGNTGGRYDPATDTWLGPTSMFHAPVPRFDHAAVWTGTHMIIWGGYVTTGGGGEVNSGGVYDLAADSWKLTSFSGAPAARLDHTAVWTGNVMVVWGGRSNASADEFDTGGRYDPVGDSWAPTSVIGAPDPRAYHTAVWTGSLMLVWGGYGRSGGRYALGNAVDDDGDGLTECAGDCNDVEAGAFAVPPEVSGLMFDADKQTLLWESVVPDSGTATVHDVLRGALGEQPGGSGDACLAPSVPGDTAFDAEIPVENEGFWYLVRGRNVCGPGSYGYRSDGGERVSTECP
jgi:hypothetical protein